MLPEDIINLIQDKKLNSAKNLTEGLLYSKLAEKLQDKIEEISPQMFEAKKAPKTDKEDDGEGMDPVGHEDGDVDNDGDSDSSDSYLKNRRKKVTKAVKNEDASEEPVPATEALKARTPISQRKQYGMKSTEYKSKSDDQQVDIQQKYYRDKAQDVQRKDAERKRDEREAERKKQQRGVQVK